MAGRQYAHGSVLLRKSENPTDVAERVERAAKTAGIPVYATPTGRAPGDGIDLGGRHFRRLERPRVALLANSPLRSNSFGHVWHHLDRRLQLPVTLLDVQTLGVHDLRRYNVIVIPDSYGSLAGTMKAHQKALTAWIEQGGTLIAMGRSAEPLAKAELGLSKARLRRDVLDSLAVYQAEAERHVASRRVAIDGQAVWNGPGAATAGAKARPPTPTKPTAPSGSSQASKPKATGEAAKELARQRDAWERRFSPRGAMLRGLVDQESWVSAGVHHEMAVLMRGDAALLTPPGVRAAVRFAKPDGLRLSGLLWPEARARLAHSAYLTVERKGRGQIILFAFEPVFRGFLHGTGRLFSNAVIYGPGLGASQPKVWHATR